MSLAYGVPAFEQVPAGHAVPVPVPVTFPFSVHTPPAQLLVPVIRPSAEAAVVKIGAGIDKLRIANAIAANPAIIHFI
jgi:hypothetical protein